MNETLFLLGPSDTETQNPTTRERVQGGVRVTTDFAGVLPILPYVTSDPILCAKSHTVLVGVHDIQLARNARVNLFNLVGDADSSRNMLHHIEIIANKIRPVRYFNPCSHVYRTSRAQLPKTLANIPGCIVPRVETANPQTFGELRAACEKFNCWPMIVRARGFHGGEHMVLLTGAAELESLQDLPWAYGGIFLIQYYDARGEDGLNQKIRVIVVDGVPHVRHCIYSDRWVVNSGSRSDLMDHDIGLCHREERVLGYLRDKGLREYAPVFQEIYQRVQLDVFGIDLALVNGQILVFEANACMSFLGDRYGDDVQYEYLDAYVKVLRREVKKMLLTA